MRLFAYLIGYSLRICIGSTGFGVVKGILVRVSKTRCNVAIIAGKLLEEIMFRYPRLWAHIGICRIFGATLG